MGGDRKRVKSRQRYKDDKKYIVKRTLETAPNKSIIIIEPFYGGSHKQLIDLLIHEFKENENRKIYLLTLPATKWHWRLRCSALYFAEMAPKLSSKNQYVLFCSSMFDLSTFLSLRPEYCNNIIDDSSSSIVKKILYFHENQLAYPTRQEDTYKREIRDFQFGYIQILSSLVADHVCFNSDFNRQSFLDNIQGHFKNLPSNQKLIKGDIERKIYSKSEVLYFPICINNKNNNINNNNMMPEDEPLHILWNHRWEHDKNPESFFQVICRLIEEVDNVSSISLSVVGESFGEVPDIFDIYKTKFEQNNNYYNKLNVKHWGYVESKEKYFNILKDADIVVSTANHEFYGVSVLEAVLHNCFPLVPNRLVYPEIYNKIPDCIYNTDNQLFKKIKDFALRPSRFRLKRDTYLLKMNQLQLEQYIWNDYNGKTNSVGNLKSRYKKLFQQNNNSHPYIRSNNINGNNSSPLSFIFTLLMMLLMNFSFIYIWNILNERL